MGRLWGVVRPGDWTAEQIDALRRLAGTMRAKDIAPLVGHTFQATQRKIADLKLPRWIFGACRNWAAEEDAALRAVPVGVSGRQFAMQYGISEMAVWHRARRLGVKFYPATRWRDDEIEQLRAMAATHTLPAAAKVLNRRYKAVQEKARTLGVKFVACGRPGRPRTTPPRAAQVREKRPPRVVLFPQWTEEQESTLRALAGQPLSVIAPQVGRTREAVRKHAARLGVRLGAEPRRARAPKPERVCVERVKAVREPRAARTAKAPRPDRVRVVKAPAVRLAKEPARKVVRREVVSRIEYCRECGAPVSNWEQHFERLGHRRPWAA
jgi:hypothetical protein